MCKLHAIGTKLEKIVKDVQIACNRHEIKLKIFFFVFINAVKI